MLVVIVLVVAGGGAWLVLSGEEDPEPKTSKVVTKTPEDSEPEAGDPIQGRAFLKAACEIPERWARLIYRGWAPGTTRAYDLSIVPHPPNYMGSFINTSHSGPYDFLQEIPMTLYGPGFVEPAGRTTLDREVTIADIAPTVAELIDFDFPQRKATPLSEVLSDTTDKPKLVVTIVIDGGGWNVLEEHPDSWPNLERLMAEGANIDNAIAGSSPSITPAVHTSIGTGAFPRQHGVTAIVVREGDGNLAGAFSEDDDIVGVNLVNPTINLRKSTVADEYDVSTGNDAKVALISPGTYQLGMIGHGAAFEGGDHDISPMLAKVEEQWGTNPTYYSAPDYINDEVAGPDADLEAVDRSDGEADGKWRGHEIPPVVATPALAPWENRIIKAVIENEGFGRDAITDLLSINYKAPDSLGHLYNMISPEEAETLESADAALGDLVDYLDSEVGEDEYVVIVTADHGQTPLEAGGWPINRDEIRADIDGRFDKVDNDVSVLEQTSASSFFMRKSEMKENGVTPEQVATFLTDYTIGDNIPDGGEVPQEFQDRLDEPIFDAVIPGRKITKVARCTGALVK